MARYLYKSDENYELTDPSTNPKKEKRKENYTKTYYNQILEKQW